MDSQTLAIVTQMRKSRLKSMSLSKESKMQQLLVKILRLQRNLLFLRLGGQTHLLRFTRLVWVWETCKFRSKLALGCLSISNLSSLNSMAELLSLLFRVFQVKWHQLLLPRICQAEEPNSWLLLFLIPNSLHLLLSRLSLISNKKSYLRSFALLKRWR